MKSLNLIAVLFALSLSSCKLMQPHKSEMPDQSAELVSHLEGTVSEKHQTIDVRLLEEPFTVKVNGVTLNKYEYSHVDGRVTFKNYAFITESGKIQLTNTPCAISGDTYLMESL